MGRRRKKPTSCRPLKLSEAQQAEARYWYFHERTAAQKARKLGVSVKTLYRYVHRKHKPRKESAEDIASQLMSLSADVPHQGAN